MQDSANKVFIISLDGATFDVLYPLARQGYLPNLARLMQTGLSAELESVIPPVTASAWTSFMTGKHPSKHGIFDFTRFDPESSSWKLNNSQYIRSKTLWHILSDKCKRVVVLSLPYTYPPYPVNGIMVSGWDAPSTDLNFTYPEQVGKEIFELIPDYGSTLDLSLWNFLPAESSAEFDSFVTKLMRSFEHGVRMATHFLDRESWDVFMVHFQQTDWIQHKLWGYIEDACRKPEDKSERLERVRQCYKQFDEGVGALLKKVEPEQPTVIVLSDHGFGRYQGAICPNYLLQQWGYFHLQAQSESKIKGFFKRSRIPAVRNLYRRLAHMKNSMSGRADAKKYKNWADLANETMPRQKFPVDWSRTKAALAVGSESAFLYVNLKGRSPAGIVEPGAEYEAIVTELIARFSEVRHPKTGAKLLKQVARGSEIYPAQGEGVLVPDIVLVPMDGFGSSAGLSEGVIVESSDEGSHRHNGVVMLTGAGLNNQIKNFRPYLIDMAPTVLHMLGLPVPSDMDGRVLEEAFQLPQDVRFEDVDNTMIQQATDYTGEEAELIEQRLKGLGYVE